MLVLKPLPSRPVSVAFSPDGARLAVGLMDATVRTWDILAGEVVGTVTVPRDAIFNSATAVFDPDGRRLIVSDAHSGVAVWEPTGKRVRTLVRKSRLVDNRPVVIAANGRLFVGGDRLLALDVAAWDAAPTHPSDEQSLLMLGSSSGPLVAEPGGRRVAAGSGELLDTESRVHAGSWRPDPAAPRARSLDWAAGRALLAATEYGPTVRVFDADAREMVAELRPSPKFTNAAVFTVDGSRLLTAGSEGVVREYDANTWSEPCVLDWNRGPIHTLAVSPDGTRAAAGVGTATRGCVVVWDL